MSNYKVRGSGIDTSTITWKTIDDLKEFPYIYTEIKANNEFLLQVPDSATLIVRAGYQDWLEEGLRSHLDALGRKHCELLLIEEGQEVREDVVSLHKAKYVGEVGIIGSDLEKLKFTEKSMKDNGIKLSYLAVEFCPLEFPLDVIEWAEENKIMIIGLNPFGGYINGPRNIQAFSVPYLLSFAATYADIVILSGRDTVKSGFSKKYLESLEGKESPSIYGLKRKVSRSIKPLKGAVGTSIGVDEKLIVPYSEPELVLTGGDHILKLGSPVSSITKVKEGENEIVDEVNTLLKTIHFPEDGGKEIMFSRARFVTIDYLKLKFPDYVQDYVKVGDSVFLMSLTRSPKVTGKWLWKKETPEDVKTFYLAMDNKEPIFDEIKGQEKTETLNNDNV